MSLRSEITDRAVDESRPVVGSSESQKMGFILTNFILSIFFLKYRYFFVILSRKKGFFFANFVFIKLKRVFIIFNHITDFSLKLHTVSFGKNIR